jgi:hypothetical protein
MTILLTLLSIKDSHVIKTGPNMMSIVDENVSKIVM